MTDELPIEHVMLHVRDTLATDARVGELGLDVSCESGLVTVRGAVSTAQRQAGVVPLVIEALRGLGCLHDVCDATHIPAAAAPATEPERL